MVFDVKEGTTIIFPGNLTHSTAFCDYRDEDITQVFDKNINDLSELKQMRVSMAGDIILTSKQPNKNAIGLQPMTFWRHYG